MAEVYFERAHWALIEAPGSDQSLRRARWYLRDRGFELSTLDHLPLGWLGDLAGQFRALAEAGFSEAEIRASGLLADRRLAGRIVGPIRDADRRIVGFWARDPEGREPKYLFWKSGPGRHPGIVGMDWASEGGPLRELTLVEDILDALALWACQAGPVAAIAGPVEQLGVWRWRQLAELGLRRVTLAVLQSPATIPDTLAALQNALRVPASLEPFVLVPHPTAPLTLAEPWVPLVPKESPRLALRGHRIHGHRYMALALLRKHRTEHGWPDEIRRAVWAEACAICAQAAVEHGDLLDRHFLGTINQHLGHGPAKPPATRAGRSASPPQSESDRLPHEFCSLHGCQPTECFCFD